MSQKGIEEVEWDGGMCSEDHSESHLVKKQKHPASSTFELAEKNVHMLYIFSSWHMLTKLFYTIYGKDILTYACKATGYLARQRQIDSLALAVVLSCYCRAVWIHLACGRNGHNTCGQNAMTFSKPLLTTHTVFLPPPPLSGHKMPVIGP